MDYESSNQTQGPQFNQTATDQGTADQNKKRGKAFFAIIGTILAMIVAAMILAFQSDSFSAEKPKADFSRKAPKVTTPFKWSIGKKIAPADDYVAKLYITGTISESNESYNQKWIMETIADLKANEKNKGIILYINSPGGGVYQSDDVYLALMDYKTTGKPVYAYFGPMAASGGYYIGCAADYIMANRNTLTGSIGVISGQFIDMTQLMDKIGIKSTTIHSGRNKIMGSPSQPMTEEQRKIMQSISDECYDQFTSIVAESRELSKEKVIELADGRVYSAKQALAASLIDSIGSCDDLVSELERKEFDYESYDIIDYKYEPPFNPYSLFQMAAKKLSNTATTDIEAGINLLKGAEMSYPAYYCNVLD